MNDVVLQALPASIIACICVDFMCVTEQLFRTFPHEEALRTSDWTQKGCSLSMFYAMKFGELQLGVVDIGPHFFFDIQLNLIAIDTLLMLLIHVTLNRF